MAEETVRPTLADATSSNTEATEASSGKSEASSVCAERSASRGRLLKWGLEPFVVDRLERIYTTGKLRCDELDERALEALREFPATGALGVLAHFEESNLEHVSNKSAYLCGIMKTFRQRMRNHLESNANALMARRESNRRHGPDEGRLRELLQRTGYTLDVTTGQRKYGGPPPNWQGPPPPKGCEVFCGKLPRDAYEDELVPLFEKFGQIYDLRLMIDPQSGLNRGFAFVTFANKEEARLAVKELASYVLRKDNALKINLSEPKTRLFIGNIPKSKGRDEIEDAFNVISDEYELRKGKRIGVTVSFNNRRLFVGSIPKHRSREELLREFTQHSPGLKEVIVYSSPDDRRKNRGFCFLEYDSHRAASLAKRRLESGKVKIWSCDIIVDWADPQDEPDEDVMAKVKVLYVRNVSASVSESTLREVFEVYGEVERAKKLKDYAFVHFTERQNAVNAMDALTGTKINGVEIEVSLAKPPGDKRRKEEVLRRREQRLFRTLGHQGLPMPSPLAVSHPFGMPMFASQVMPVTQLRQRRFPVARGVVGGYYSGYWAPGTQL